MGIMIPETSPYVEDKSGPNPDLVPVRMELKGVINGTKIPESVWRPLFGGEELTQGLWDKLLPSEGDEVIVKGSSVARMFFGGYFVDRKTGLAPRSLRTDIDVVVYGSSAKNAAQFEGKQRTVARTTDVAGIPIDLISSERVRAVHKAGIGEMVGIINGAVSSGISQELIVMRRLLLNHSKFLDEASPESLFAADAFWRHEAIGMKLTRNAQGKIEATVLDPLDNFTPVKLLGPSLVHQEEVQAHDGTYVGFAFENQNPMSTYSVFMEVVRALPDIRFAQIFRNYERQYVLDILVKAGVVSGAEINRLIGLFPDQSVGMILERVCDLPEEKFAEVLQKYPDPDGRLVLEAARALPETKFKQMLGLYAELAISRIIVSACELDIDLWVDPFSEFHPKYPFFLDIYSLADRMARGVYPVELLEDVLGDAATSEWDQERMVKRSIQSAFARAAFSNASHALSYVFLFLPFGRFVSEDLNEDFGDHHRTVTPNTSIIYRMLLEGYNSTNLPEEADHPAMRAILRVHEIAFRFYKSDPVAMKEVKALGRSVVPGGSDGSTVTFDMGTSPENMSEVIALICVAVGWDAQRDAEKIRSLVSGWIPEGNLELSWRGAEDVEFDVGLDVAAIERKMAEFQKVSDEIDMVIERSRIRVASQ